MFINAALTPEDVARTLERTDDAFVELRHSRAALPPQNDARVMERLRRAALATEPA
ncbi:hypothetical protein [Luteibacter sp.]|uniref:hypothetical protein n=1 Tax=Luteibacter sp. TaxID=1886636 RepID=UPI0025BDEE84|nr:hypothetical protein [Luteibacter sp.]